MSLDACWQGFVDTLVADLTDAQKAAFRAALNETMQEWSQRADEAIAKKLDVEVASTAMVDDFNAKLNHFSAELAEVDNLLGTVSWEYFEDCEPVMDFKASLEERKSGLEASVGEAQERLNQISNLLNGETAKQEAFNLKRSTLKTFSDNLPF